MVTPKYPMKAFNYSTNFGNVMYDSNSTNWGTHFLPTDGTTTYTYRTGANNTPVSKTIGAGNNLKSYMMTPDAAGCKWDFYFDFTTTQINSMTAQNPGMNKTVGQDFIDTYVTLAESMGVNWWAEVSNMSESGTGPCASRTSTIAQYEAAFGPFCDYIEKNCSANFIGYSAEGGYETFYKWLLPRTNYAVSNKDWSAWIWSGLQDANYPNITGLQHYGELDQVVIEAYFMDTTTSYDEWASNLGAYASAYPNQKVVFNFDQPCHNETWSGTPPSGHAVDGGNDNKYWATSGGCLAEKNVALARINKLNEILTAARGHGFDGYIYNTYDNSGYPLCTCPNNEWFLGFADSMYIHMPQQKPGISVALDGGSGQSLNFNVTQTNNPVYVLLKLYSGGVNVSATYKTATVTFSVTGTSISKSTADDHIHTDCPQIFYNIPTTTVSNSDAPGFYIRLYPAEIDALSAGNYTYNLTVTT